MLIFIIVHILIINAFLNYTFCYKTYDTFCIQSFLFLSEFLDACVSCQSDRKKHDIQYMCTSVAFVWYVSSNDRRTL